MKIKIKQAVLFGVLSLIGITGASVLASGNAYAATCFWDGGAGADNQFSNFSNWDGACNPPPVVNAGIPQEGDNIVFPADITDNGSAIVINNLLRSIGSIAIYGRASANGHALLIQTSTNQGYDSNPMGDISVDTIMVENNQQMYLTHLGGGSIVPVGARQVALGNGNSILSFQMPFKLGSASAFFSTPSVTVNPTSTTPEDLGYVSFAQLDTVSDASLNFTAVRADLPGTNPNHNGGIALISSTIKIADNMSLGPNTNQNSLTMTNSQLKIRPTVSSLDQNLSINGNLFGKSSPLIDQSYAAILAENPIDNQSLTLSGDIGLASNVDIGDNRPMILSGSVSGSGGIQLSDTGTDKKGSLSLTGTVTNTGATSSSTLYIVTNNQATKAVNILSGGTLKGTGTVGAVNIASGGKLAPGQSPGCLASGNLTLNSGSTYEAEIAGTTACTQYDQMNVTGTVSLGNASLSAILLNGFTASQGNTFTIINNDGADPVTGTFNNLAEGATFTVGTTVFKITYAGGDNNNDVVLSVQNVPTTPNTGIRLITSNPLATLLITSLSAGTLLYIAKRYKFTASRVR